MVRRKYVKREKNVLNNVPFGALTEMAEPEKRTMNTWSVYVRGKEQVERDGILAVFIIQSRYAEKKINKEIYIVGADSSSNELLINILVEINALMHISA